MLALSPEEVKNCAILAATQKGRGKRTAAPNFAVKGRGGQGVIALRLIGDDTLVGAVIAGDSDELMLITDAGVLQRNRYERNSPIGAGDTRRSFD